MDILLQTVSRKIHISLNIMNKLKCQNIFIELQYYIYFFTKKRIITYRWFLMQLHLLLQLAYYKNDCRNRGYTDRDILFHSYLIISLKYV